MGIFTELSHTAIDVSQASLLSDYWAVGLLGMSLSDYRAVGLLGYSG